MGKILLVEDEVVISLSASMILEDEGFTVIQATNGLDGLAKAKSESPDLIVTDYMMPRMDGLAMIRALRQEGITVPILLITSIPQRRLAADSGAHYDAYLGKPFRDEDLVRAVRRLMESRSKRFDSR